MCAGARSRALNAESTDPETVRRIFQCQSWITCSPQQSCSEFTRCVRVLLVFFFHRRNPARELLLTSTSTFNCIIFSNISSLFYLNSNNISYFQGLYGSNKEREREREISDCLRSEQKMEFFTKMTTMTKGSLLIQFSEKMQFKLRVKLRPGVSRWMPSQVSIAITNEISRFLISSDQNLSASSVLRRLKSRPSSLITF